MQARRQFATELGPVGKVLSQPFGLRQLAAIMRLGIGRAAIPLLDHSQAVAGLGQCFAKPGNGGKLGHQGLEQLQGLGEMQSSAGLVSPSSISNCPSASSARARSLRTSLRAGAAAVAFSKRGDRLAGRSAGLP